MTPPDRIQERDAAIDVIDRLYIAGDLDALSRIAARAADRLKMCVADLVQRGKVRP